MPDKNKMSIVVFSGDLDHALAAFMLAITGASMAMEVNMFFTFWGLNIIRKEGGVVKTKGFLRRMMNLINHRNAKNLAVSKFNMLGLGTWAMKRLMEQIDMPPLDELIVMAHDIGVKFTACTTTMELMGLTKDSFRSEVDAVSGSAYFLNQASKSKVSLFI